jgi:O-antigen/teichoic acid export membrane protein
MVKSVTHKNIIANYAGALITTLTAFILTPVYIHYIGIGAYGIIGFYISLQAIFVFLDLGIGVAVNREMAKYFNDDSKLGYLRNLAHSLQIVYWSIGILLGACLFVAAPYIANGWFKTNDIPKDQVKNVFTIFALTIAARWPYGLYSQGLRGMQKQVSLNAFELVFNLLKSIGSWLILKYVSPTLGAFLWYQLFITVLQTLGIFIIFWKFLSKNNTRPQFKISILKNLSRYAAGMGIGIILVNLVAQLDKIIVSKMVSDTMFGYYAIANNIAMLVYSISLPMYMAIFPHFTKQVQENNDIVLAKEFHYYAKLLSTLLLPFGVIVVFNAPLLLQLWTSNSAIVSNSSEILQWLICGTMCVALIMPVHTLLHAKVRIRFMIYSQLVELILTIPVIYFLIGKYGVKGGAMGMCVLYLGYLFIQGPLILKIINLKQVIISWYINDILIFLPPLIIVAYFFKTILLPHFLSNEFSQIIYITILILVSYLVSFAFNRVLVIQIINKIKKIFN